MAHLVLAEFLEELERRQQLIRVGVEVGGDQELGAVSRRMAEEQTSAVLFTNGNARAFPLATNLLHSADRLGLALGVKSLADLQQRSQELLRPVSQGGWLDALRLAPPQARWLPRIVKTGACQQVVRLASDVDLRALVDFRWWPADEAPSLPAVVAYVQATDDAWRGLELCSATLLDETRLLLDWEPHRSLARLWRENSIRGERVPLALSFGGHPLEMLAAAAPLPCEFDRWTLCGWLRDRSCDLVRARTLPIDVPADAEILVEGFLDPAAPHVSVPRHSELSGFYSQPRDGVVMQVTAVTHRTNPIQVAVQPRKPPHEVGSMRAAMLEGLKPLLTAAVPGLVDYHLPPSAGCRHVAFVSITKSRHQQARQMAGALWACEPWMFARLLVVVDEDANVRDEQDILFRIASHADPARDVFQQAAACETSHHASQVSSVASLMGIDATRKTTGEHGRPWPAELGNHVPPTHRH